MDTDKIVGRVCKALEMDKFYVIKRLKLPKDGYGTRASLDIARLIKDAGYEVVSTEYTYDMQKADWKLYVVFRKEGLPLTAHTFNGFSWGYGGEGPHGLVEFGEMFGLGLDKNKVFGGARSSLPEKATVPLSVFK